MALMMKINITIYYYYYNYYYFNNKYIFKTYSLFNYLVLIWKQNNSMPCEFHSINTVICFPNRSFVIEAIFPLPFFLCVFFLCHLLTRNDADDNDSHDTYLYTEQLTDNMIFKYLPFLRC